MKKGLIILLLTSLCLTACAKEKTEVTSKETSSTATPAPKYKEYNDDTISCSYDASTLKVQTLNPTDNLEYGIIIYDAVSNNITDDTSITICTSSHSTQTDEINSSITTATELIFNSLFKIEHNDTTKVVSEGSNSYKFSSKVNDIEYYGKLLYIDDSELTWATCCIYPNEKEQYKEALKKCFDSIKYVKINDPLEKAEEEAKEAAKNATEITSGKLYDSIKSIDNKVKWIIKTDDSYSLDLTCNNPKNFFKSCEIIYKNSFKEKSSVVFSMSSKQELVATLTVVKNKSKNTYPLHSTIIVFDKKKEKKIEAAYSKNKYWKKHDLDNQSDKEFKKILKKYSLN